MRPYAILIPNFNRAHTVVEAVDSIVKQRHELFDIIIQDDCSQDDSVAILRRTFGHTIQIEKNTENLGYIGNVNKCLAYGSQYQWVGILHSDDRHEGDSLAAFAGYIKRFPDAGVIFSRTNDMDANGVITVKATGTERVIRPDDVSAKVKLGALPYSTIIYKDSALAKYGGYSERFPYSADEEFNARLTQEFTAVEMNGVYGSYRRHAGQTMMKSWAAVDFIPTYEDMKMTMNAYLPVKLCSTVPAVRKMVAQVLVDHCSGLVAHGRLDIARKFYQYAWAHNRSMFKRPSIVARWLLHHTPVAGRIVCRRYSVNAGF